MDKILTSDLKSLLSKINLEITDMTLNYETYEHKLDKIIQYCKEAACHDVSYPGIFNEKYLYWDC